MESSLELEYPVVVSIDFGTTYSGVAYALTANDNRDVYDVTLWPKQIQHSYSKTPTEIMYDRNTHKVTYWGNAARTSVRKTNDKHHHFRQFKLYYDEVMSEHLKPLPEGFDHMKLSADFLRKLHDHAAYEISKAFGSFPPERYRYCLTVPAIWSDKAKSEMREVAKLAGLINEDDHPDRLMLISEPEAAALYCENHCQTFNMNDGDEFIICDAGGGTVDLIAFRARIDEKGNRRFEESTKGLGGVCGSVFIDRRMRLYLKEKLKHLMTPKSKKEFEHVMEEFVQNQKHAMDGIDGVTIKTHVLRLTSESDPSIGLEDNHLYISPEEYKKIIDPVVDQVIELIYQQKEQTTNLKAILMVGGFSRSNYLYSRVCDEFESKNINVYVPQRAEMAVTRGAVYYAMTPRKITTRVLRKWYGIDYTTPFDPLLDPPELKIIRADGEVRCDNRFCTYARRGESLEYDQCVSRWFKTYYPDKTACTIYAADTEDEPRYITQPGVKKIFELIVPMPFIEDAKPGDRVEFEIRIYFGDVELRVEAQIRGKVYETICNFNV
ncbi:uncharacterized protein BYT42DRAFT_556812 [Radiomyces spectabilis]|uniref:uncharacterized protein n=1 Tax=Radiomyces spectabilis TaxID=64574 RepID=UPI00221FF2C1|nr:uncharacterized protein BYT42DRAFT_556812 [Radiomyces spectabilis]KAI8391423.1 hypothetical protein BYT42DRAFT_556812 [Radiomyces spectabilis]